jgi:hypothetical protein
MKIKQSLYSNYIPNKSPNRPNFKKWFLVYKNDLYILYEEFKNVIERNFERHLDFSEEKVFITFVQFVYSYSTKHIQL